MTVLSSSAFFLLQIGSAQSPLLPFLFQIAAIFGIFYFLMIRPQQKQKKEHHNYLSRRATVFCAQSQKQKKHLKVALLNQMKPVGMMNS